MTTLTLLALLQVTAAAGDAQDFEAAYRQSVQKNQPLVVLLGADWCPSCKVMDKTIMPKVAKDGGLDKVSYAYVDVDDEPKLASALLSGRSIPQLVRLQKTPKGWLRHQLTGAHPVPAVKQFIATGAVPKPPAIPVSRQVQQ